MPISGNFGDITPTPDDIVVSVSGNWISGRIINSLLNFQSSVDDRWGLLKFHLENCNSDNYVTITILNASTDAELASLGSFKTDGDKEIALTDTPAVGSNDIKIKVNFTQYNRQVILSNLELLPLSSW